MLDAVVGPSHQRSRLNSHRGYPTLPSSRVVALIDTGAEGSLVDSKVIKALGLVASGSIPIGSATTGNSLIHASVYDVEIAIGSGADLRAFPLDVIEQPIGIRGHGLILGRDFLDQCDSFCYGPGGIFRLTY